MLKHFILSVAVAAAVLVCTTSLVAQMSAPGQVVDVIDGKTVIVSLPGGNVKVELQYIDVPEPGQQLSDTVKAHLRDLVLNKTVEYRPRNLKWDHSVGRLLLKGVDISQQMLRDGAAWHVPSAVSGQFGKDLAEYAAMETLARNEKRGLWAIKDLKPAWEVRAEAQQNEMARAKYPLASARVASDQSGTRKPGLWADVNVLLGNVGALRNGYNAEQKKGYFGTPLLGVNEGENAVSSDRKTAIEITYYYKEEEKGRRGFFVVSVMSAAKTTRFLKNNDLVMLVDGKPTVIGKAKAESSKAGDDVLEHVTYRVERAALEKMANGAEVVLRINDYLMKPSPGLQMLLYNMLQLSA